MDRMIETQNSTENSRETKDHFNWELYTGIYEDLRQFTNYETAHQHWLQFGNKEGRISSEQQLYKKLGKPPRDFDWQDYLKLNPDLEGKISNKWQAINHFLTEGVKTDRKYSKFDWQLYTTVNEDLKHLTSYGSAYQHWLHFGKKEERIASEEQFYEKFGRPPLEFDWEEYLELNPDLEGKILNKWQAIRHFQTEGFKTGRKYSKFDWQLYTEIYEDLNQFTSFEAARQHWLQFGKKEGRIYSREQLFIESGFTEEDLPENFDWEEYLQINPDLQEKIKTKWQAIKHFLMTGIAEGRKYSQDMSYGWKTYLKWGDILKIKGKFSESIQAYYRSILLNNSEDRIYRRLGDIFLSTNQFGAAANAYTKALELNPHSFWASYNLGVAYAEVKLWQKAVESYRRAITINPKVGLPKRALREVLINQWGEAIAKSDYFLQSGNRKATIEAISRGVEKYKNGLHQNLYIPTIKTSKTIPEVISIILIVDDFLPQCLHYRVQQKIEQLKYAGFSVTCFSKEKVLEAKDQLHFHHVVIFYRVPAFPNIIETIEYAKAIKKVVFYEIDDLIFDEQYYPESIESYGGQVSQQQYYGLVKGTTFFREAMALCDYAIASTPALASEMQKIVIQKKAFVHRNALDSLNLEFLKLRVPKLKRDYISIFYGTGTKAHNSDFDELLAPALAKILAKYPQVRFTVVGYLTLPEELCLYENQIDQVEIVKDIKTYWEFLAQADINIAVLRETKFNNCKSELKWFEAANVKVPSVVSSTRTYSDILEDGVDVLIARTPEEWFEKLEILIKDSGLRSSIALAAYRKAWKNYNVPVMAKNIQQIIQTGINNAIEEGKLAPRSSKIKLLIVNVFYPPQSIGGATRVVKDNVDILKEKYSDKYEISIFTTDNDNPISYQIAEYSYGDIWVTKVSTPMMEKMDWQYKNPEMYDLFKKYLEFNRPDLIHFHCVQRLTGSILEAAVDLKIPYLVTVHDAWWISDYQFLVNEEGLECDYQQSDPLIAVRDSKNLAESICRRRYLQKQLNQAKAILAVSETFTEIYRRNGFIQTQTNRNGIIPKPKLPRLPSATGRVRLAHIGGISAHKGYHLLQRVIKSCDLGNVELTVVDHAHDSNQVIRREMWNKTPVTFVGKTPQEEMYKFYATIDVLVAPSIWPESFGLVTREAAAAGVWVVASNKGALAEDLQIGVNGDIFSPDKPRELIDILEKINDNPTEYQQILSANVNIRTVEEQVAELGKIYAAVFPMC